METPNTHITKDPFFSMSPPLRKTDKSTSSFNTPVADSPASKPYPDPKTSRPSPKPRPKHSILCTSWPNDSTCPWTFKRAMSST